MAGNGNIQLVLLRHENIQGVSRQNLQVSSEEKAQDPFCRLRGLRMGGRITAQRLVDIARDCGSPLIVKPPPVEALIIIPRTEVLLSSKLGLL